MGRLAVQREVQRAEIDRAASLQIIHNAMHDSLKDMYAAVEV